MKNATMHGKRVLITGAGSGIGRQTAFAFAERGAALWLTDIDREGLQRTALLCEKLGVPVQSRRVDVSDAGAMRELANEVHTEGGALDVLVNNAGVGVAGNLVETEPEDWDFALGVNVMGVVHGCRFFGSAMVERGKAHTGPAGITRGGHIVNLASAAGLLAPPGMSIYAATKFAVVGLSESLRAEVAGHGVEVTTVCPGVVNTPIVRSTRLTGSLAGNQRFTDRTAALYDRRGYGPEKVAAALVKAVEQGRGGVLPVTPEAWGMYIAKRLVPGLVNQATKRGRVI